MHRELAKPGVTRRLLWHEYLAQHPGGYRYTQFTRLWLYLRERYLSHRLLADYEAVVNTCCDAWNALVAEKGRIQSLTNYPYLNDVTS